MNEYQKHMFAEQLRVSTDKVNQLQNDRTPEGTKEFYKHAQIIEEIAQRMTIYTQYRK